MQRPLGKGERTVSNVTTNEVPDGPALDAASTGPLPAPAAPGPPEAGPGPSLRGERDFWLVWSGQSVSLLGDGLYGIAMAWWITQTLGSATALAGYALC